MVSGQLQGCTDVPKGAGQEQSTELKDLISKVVRSNDHNNKCVDWKEGSSTNFLVNFATFFCDACALYHYRFLLAREHYLKYIDTEHFDHFKQTEAQLQPLSSRTYRYRSAIP